MNIGRRQSDKSQPDNPPRVACLCRQAALASRYRVKRAAIQWEGIVRAIMSQMPLQNERNVSRRIIAVMGRRVSLLHRMSIRIRLLRIKRNIKSEYCTRRHGMMRNSGR